MCIKMGSHLNQTQVFMTLLNWNNVIPGNMFCAMTENVSCTAIITRMETFFELQFCRQLKSLNVIIMAGPYLLVQLSFLVFAFILTLKNIAEMIKHFHYFVI